MPDPISWTKLLDQIFWKITQTLTSVPALGLSDYHKSFCLFIHENQGMGSGVLLQWFGPMLQPVAYYSVQLDPVAQEAVPCLRAMEATIEIVKCTRDLVLGHRLILKIFAILLKSQTQAFTQQHLAQYEAKLFTSDHVSFKRCSTLNSATLLPREQSEEILHDLVHDAELPQPNLTDVLLQNPDVDFFYRIFFICTSECEFQEPQSSPSMKQSGLPSLLQRSSG